MFSLDNAFSNHRRTWLSILFVAVAAGLSPAAASVRVQPLSVERLPDGNTLMADGGPLSTPGRARA
jgi:hypothetical protein